MMKIDCCNMHECPYPSRLGPACRDACSVMQVAAVDTLFPQKSKLFCSMSTAAGVLPAPSPAQGFPETNRSLHALPSQNGTPGTDPRTPGNGSPLAPGGLAATLRNSPSREFVACPTSPVVSHVQPGTVCSTNCSEFWDRPSQTRTAPQNRHLGDCKPHTAQPATQLIQRAIGFCCT